MKKHIEEELKELAISVLSNNSETDINMLKEQASNIYERLCVLAYVRNTSSEITPEPENTTVTEAIQKPIHTHEVNLMQFESKEVIEEATPAETLIELEESTPVIEKKPIETNVSIQNSPDLLFELEELTAGFENMPEFERATPVSPKKIINKVNETVATANTSLNESLKKGITIGLNDRLAFVKHLFNNNQEDYSRVISQLNTLESSSGAINFIQQMVKPEYNNWEEKEAFEERFINAVISKFDN